jgi:hypothetical protein
MLAEGAVVWMVRVVASAAPLGLTLLGLKPQVDSAGNPEQLNVTVGVKLANGSGVTVRLVCTLCPRATERFDWLVTVKSTTIRDTAVDDDPAEFGSPP